MSNVSAYVSHADAFLAGDDSPVRLFDACVDTIAMKEPEVRAFVHLDIERARIQVQEAEKRWRKNAPLSLLDGMVIGVKDIIETQEFPTGQGIPELETQHTFRDAASVAAMRAAGAIVIGKTVTTEFASTELFYPTKNPHDLNRTPGGSSSGSAAAVGAAMVPLALASQVVGSTLRPASYNGAFGYKPTWGGLNRSGAYDYLSQSCVGIIGGHLDDIWISTRQIATRAGGDPGHVGVLGPDVPVSADRPTRVAVLLTDGWLRASDEVKATFSQILHKLSAAGISVVDATSCSLVAGLEKAIAGAFDKTWRVLEWEMRWPLNTYNHPDNIGISQAMKMRLDKGDAMTQADYAAALSERDSARARLHDVMNAYDCILTLGAVSAAPLDFSTTGDPSFNIPASYLGAPALSLPLLQDQGMPLGLQMISGHRQDARLFSLAKWIVDWAQDKRG
ncbi:amidase [Pantoea sp. AS-PWVM4]|uniref:amidase n=1 Tax=Pantoea sp. AS-PWVM4 TaxID=1332069 RepID=UPI0003AC6DE9|nr:amidase [Pantoea sp. AS-PWVM4]ERK16288.1 amidase [Pantoea sp. AS-PWVM4]